MRRTSAGRGRLRSAAILLAVGLSLVGCRSIDVPPAQLSPVPTAATSAPGSSPSGPVASETAFPTRPSSTPGTPTLSPDDPVDRVLAISIDALNPDAITRLGAEKTPTLHRMMREGAWTLNARTEQELTNTLPNHAGMLTGRRVAAKTGGHGVFFNDDNGKTVHQAAGEYVSSVFDVVHDHGESTAMFSAKEKFAFFARSWNAAGAPDRVGVDDGRRKIDRVVLDSDNIRLVEALRADLATTARAFTFLHISLPDVAGHAHGFMGKDYLAAVEQTDHLLGSVLDTISSQPEMDRHLLVILTADHGGLGASHSDPTRIADYRVPFMVWGPGVAAGEDLYALNPSFVDPSKTRPGYGGPQPIRNGDVANLVTDVLDLPPVPGSQLDRPRTLDAFG